MKEDHSDRTFDSSEPIGEFPAFGSGMIHRLLLPCLLIKSETGGVVVDEEFGCYL